MKKVIFICLMALVPSILDAQDIVSKLINEYKGTEGITTVEINKNLFNIFSTNDSNDDELNYLSNNINSIRIITNEDNKAVINFYDFIMKSIDPKIYKELVRVKEGKQDVKILAKDNDGKISELLIITNEDDESAVVSILGNIDIMKMKGLGNSIKIDGMEYLDEIEEKN
jgi:hypothetical protein